MLALKLQKLTTRTLLRPSQLRFVQGSTTIIQTYKHGWRRINNPKERSKLPPMVPSVTHARSPRVQSSEQKVSNYKDYEEESPEEELSLKDKALALFVAVFLLLVATGPSPVLKEVRGVLWLVQYMWENDERIPGELKDVRGVIEEENAMWLDQYMSQNRLICKRSHSP